MGQDCALALVTPRANLSSSDILHSKFTVYFTILPGVQPIGKPVKKTVTPAFAYGKEYLVPSDLYFNFHNSSDLPSVPSDP